MSWSCHLHADTIYFFTAIRRGHVICTLKQFTVLLQHVLAMSSARWYNLLCHCNMPWPCHLYADTMYCVTATRPGHVIYTLTQFTVLLQHVAAMSSTRWHNLLCYCNMSWPCPVTLYLISHLHREVLQLSNSFLVPGSCCGIKSR